MTISYATVIDFTTYYCCENKLNTILKVLSKHTTRVTNLENALHYKNSLHISKLRLSLKWYILKIA